MRFLLTLTLILAIGGPALASDGMIEINHFSALAGGVNGDLALDPPGYPVTISQSGSCQLTGHMPVPDANTSVGILGQPGDGIGGHTVYLNGLGISNGITIQCNSIHGAPSCP